MNWASDNQDETLQLFKQTMSYHCEGEGFAYPDRIACKILRGNEGLKHLNASGMSDAHKKKPDKICDLFESNLNFRVHRLHMIDYRQGSEESVDDFITRTGTQALKCEFEQSDLGERIYELLIASIPIEALLRELLGKAKGYKLTDALAERGGETIRGHSRWSTGDSETCQHTSEQRRSSSTTLRQLWSSPFTKSLSCIQRLM